MPTSIQHADVASSVPVPPRQQAAEVERRAVNGEGEPAHVVTGSRRHEVADHVEILGHHRAAAGGEDPGAASGGVGARADVVQLEVEMA
jgi:hypothetical protein